MSEIDDLLTKAERALKTAHLTLEDGDFESSVSRAYYAMFYATEALLLSKSLSFSSHRSVLSLFGEHFIKVGIFERQLGKRLNTTFENRMTGDYSYALKIDRETAEESLEWAKDFVRQARDYIRN